MAKLDIEIPDLTLPDGSKIPMLGFGSGTAWYKSDPNGPTDKKLIESLKKAVEHGYLHLDGADMYNTESELGEAIKGCGVSREKLFITTKVNKNVNNVSEAIDASLKRLGLSYVDLYLIHQPWSFPDEAALQKCWADMENVLASGRAKSIGVSNFYRPHLESLLKTAKVRPAINQIEFHPYLQHEDLIAFMKNQDIRVAAYAPQLPVTKLTGGPVDPVLEQLAKKYGVNPGDVLLRWCLDQNIVAITTTSKEQRMSDYLRICTFTLNPKEVTDISEAGDKQHHRQYWTNYFDKDDRS